MFSHNWPSGAWRIRRAEASSQNFQRIRQAAPRCLTLSWYAVKANGANGRIIVMSTIALLIIKFLL